MDSTNTINEPEARRQQQEIVPTHWWIMDQKAIDIIRGMKPWYGERCGSKIEFQDMRAEASACRTHDQTVWDHAIIAVAEFVRRRLDFNEKLALEIHGMLSANLPKDV